MDKNQALLIIDAQINMFNENFYVYQANQLIKRLQHLVKQARLKSVPVIWVRNNGGKGEPDEPGTLGWKIHPSLRPKKGELVVDKYEPSAFKDTNLLFILKQNRIIDLVIAGMQTEICIDSTVRQAVEFGFNVIIVEDGHSTFDSKEMKAIEIIEKYNKELNDIAKIEKAGNIIFQ
ncbi:MAG: cysteine hydrolase family protein [Candidatus Hodarchaeota archaeon]